jgi:hypothetical protein
MAQAQNGAALYLPPRGAAIYGYEGYAALNCTIVGVGPTNLVSAYVRQPVNTGPYSAFSVENVPYCDADTPAADVPVNGGYVAPVGFVIPEPVAPAVVEDQNGNALIPGQVIWANPNTTPTSTPLDDDVATNNGYLPLPMN